jgi:hypothetical protein
MNESAMSCEMKTRGTAHEEKMRSPWAVALLPIITFGTYHSWRVREA